MHPILQVLTRTIQERIILLDMLLQVHPVVKEEVSVSNNRGVSIIHPDNHRSSVPISSHYHHLDHPDQSQCILPLPTRKSRHRTIHCHRQVVDHQVVASLMWFHQVVKIDKVTHHNHHHLLRSVRLTQLPATDLLLRGMMQGMHQPHRLQHAIHGTHTAKATHLPQWSTLVP